MTPDEQTARPSGLASLIGAMEAAARRRGIDARPEWDSVRQALHGAWQADNPRLAQEADARSFDPQTAIHIDTALDRIAAVFALDALTADILLVAAAADIDPNIAAGYGLLLGANTPQPATFALGLELAGVALTAPAGRHALGAEAPLRRWGLVTIGEAATKLTRSLQVADDVIGALLGADLENPIAFAAASPAPGIEDVHTADGVAELTAALAVGRRFCWVENASGGAGVAAARTAFAAADLRCVVADYRRAPHDDPEVTVTALIRWAGLHSAGLIVDSAELIGGSGGLGGGGGSSGAGGFGGGAGRAPGGIHAAIDRLASAPMPVVLVGNCRWNAGWHRMLPWTVRCGPLPVAERVRLWRRHLSPDDIPDEVFATYRLTPEQIDTAARAVAVRAAVAARPAEPSWVTDAVRMLGGSPATAGATSGVPATFDDLQVPAETRQTLERLTSWVRLREEVVSRGAVHGVGGKGSGITALFTGSPGTGKTLAAHVIADAVGLDLMQVDLSGVIDKYIGETEKNLERVFTEAESLNVVLFFDEADALFGKRSDVKDAHDRFANQEVAYLLQRIEKFDGITVLATNLKGNLDVAFARRMHFVVHFPDPDEATRARLWTTLLAHAGDIDQDDPVDVPRLAHSIELAGGDLRNIVLGAVYDAAAEGSGLGMRHLTAAAIREHTKLGRRAPVI